jgi:3-oxoacyl-[acyl-carrier protein] reductase
MDRLQGKVALVTGASKGIGAGIARALGDAGASVVVNYASDKAGANKIVADIKDKGGKAVAVQGDVSKASEVKQLFEQTKKAFGKLDVLVNNAGVFNFAPIEETSEAEYQRQFGVNVLGPLLATREALPLFGPQGGSVINISSIVSRMGIPGSSIYAGTKGALDSITLVLASELGPRKIRVNSINPGMVESEGTHAAGFIGGDFQKNIEAQAPLGRIGQPEDIAKVAVFLASDESSWLTGERISASGGYR